MTAAAKLACGAALALCAGTRAAATPALPALAVDPEALVELAPLAIEAFGIFQRASAREARHAAELRAKGVAEVPPTGSDRHVVDLAGLGAFGALAFDDWGEVYVDRRFVTDDEMKTVRAVEAWIAKWFPGETRRRARPRATAGESGLPVFRGFEAARYQEHDRLIAEMTAAFNADKAGWCGGTAAQAAKIADLTPALVKAHMIEESGGNGPRSKAAWAVDPLQVNVPGDWGPEKELVGLDYRRHKLPKGVEGGGHGGSHGYLTDDFLRAILDPGHRPCVDVVTALNTTVAGIYAHLSAMKGGEVLKVPSVV